MAIAGTLTLALAIGACIPPLAAIASASSPTLVHWRPIAITILVGFVLLEAYIIAFTLAVEEGGSRLYSDARAPRLVAQCPPFMDQTRTGGCKVADATSITPGAEAPTAYLESDAFASIPGVENGGRLIDAKLTPHLRAGIPSRTKGLANKDTAWFLDTCCAANKVPYTDLNIMCPSSKLLECAAATRSSG